MNGERPAACFSARAGERLTRLGLGEKHVWKHPNHDHEKQINTQLTQTNRDVNHDRVSFPSLHLEAPI